MVRVGTYISHATVSFTVLHAGGGSGIQGPTESTSTEHGEGNAQDRRIEDGGFSWVSIE